MQNEIQEYLNNLIDNIQKQEIRLLKIDFKANEKRSGIFAGTFINSELKIPIKKIGTGEATESKENKNYPIIFADYEFDLQYFINGDDEEYKENIILINANYRVTIFLKEKIEDLLEVENKEDIAKILNLFFNNTGRIIVYPYFRNTSDILIRESGYVLPPLPPLKINNEK